MEYTIFGSKGYVSQNVGYDGFNNSQANIMNKCKNGVYICTAIDPIKSIDQLEYNMIYYDSIFNWSHRNNILDKHHTHVSIGIAYDKYSFVLVQNFANNYIEFDKPIIKVNNLAYNRYDTKNDDNDSKGDIEISGKVIANNDNNNSIDSIHVYYDEKPTFLIYNQHKNDNLYDMGELVANTIKQLPNHHLLNQYYKQSSSSNYRLIQATKWWISTTPQAGQGSRQRQQQSLDIQFNISSLLKSEGVYTIVVYLRDNNNHDTFPVTSYSIFFFH
jgi:hypothetical protein